MTKGREYCEIRTRYPAPEEDEKCCKFLLDPLGRMEEDMNYRVELVPGRVETVDGTNRNFIMGSITEGELKGFGYSYYKVKLGPMGSTRMMPRPGVEPREEFVSIGKTQIIPYNSRLPVVVYLPKNAELRYRIWTAGEVHGAEEQ